jgi:hypothetical protein
MKKVLITKKENISHDKFKSMLFSNEEFEFEYNDITYEIVHNPPYVELYFDVKYINRKNSFQKYEKYSSASELLELSRIENQKIEDIWEEFFIINTLINKG